MDFHPIKRDLQMSGDKTQKGSIEWIQACLVRSFYRCESQIIYLKPLKT